MKTVLLTQGQCAVLDDGDFERIRQYQWHAHWTVSGQRFYARTNVPRDDGGQTTLLMHRVVTDAPAGVTVDHIDGNALNNTRINLRLATKSQNSMNRCAGPNRNSTSGFRGVTWHKRVGKWAAQIGVGRVRKHLGCFDSVEDAAAAYADANKKYFGEFGGGL